jgi:hypothetical protein
MFQIHDRVFSTWDEVVQYAYDEWKVIVEDENPPATTEEMKEACKQLEDFLR